jgi:diphthamide synthase subunit DPH2
MHAMTFERVQKVHLLHGQFEMLFIVLAGAVFSAKTVAENKVRSASICDTFLHYGSS